ncbi:MAG TPA: carboxypeptidase-like regulatory domain-containing protein [Thermoanaerobaculia bacterium]|nr:carboxypeptidase-like regulatory domain-containing protein [Thermoanaerobaculia bacterium]
MVRFDVRKIAILLLLAAPAAQAQPWHGPAALEVRVEDQKGLPVGGAQVQLQYTAVPPADGPAPVLTDARGRATVGGLAEGAWRLSVSHDGFMTYQVEVNVRGGGRPALTGATQIKVSGSLRTMEVQVSRGRSVPSTSPASPAPSRVTPVRPVEPAPRQEPTPAPAPAPSPPAPAPAVQPQETPATPPRPAPPVPAPAPTPKPMPPPAPAPKPQPVPPPAPAPTPKPVPPPAPTPPAAAPETPPPAAPPAERLRTSKERNCVECQPGESALSLEWTVSPGGGAGGCGADIAKRLAGGDVPAELATGCHVLRIALPAGVRYTAYRYEVLVADDSLDCPTGKDCPRNMGRWPMDPVLVRGTQGTVILAPFEPGPSQAERRAVLTVYFTAGNNRR